MWVACLISGGLSDQDREALPDALSAGQHHAGRHRSDASRLPEADMQNMRVRITGSEIIVEPADQRRESYQPTEEVADGDALATL